MAAVKLRCTRPMLHSGSQFEAGDLLDLAPAAAADALESGRVELVDAADRPAVWAGRTAAVQRELRQHGRQMPHPGSPWAPAPTPWN
jgi:hypothetical protein